MGFNPFIDPYSRQIFFEGFLTTLPSTLNSDFGGLALGAINLRVWDSRGKEIQGTLALNARFKHAFISDRPTKGDMSGLTYSGCSGTGVQRADCACRVQAKLAGLPNSTKFKAFLETDVLTIKCRLANMTGECTTVPPDAGGPWYSPRKEISAGIFGRVKYFSEMFDLLANNITTNAFGGEHPTANIWTGTDANGDAPGTMDHCQNWTNGTASYSGIVGSNTEQGNWANSNNIQNCSTEHYIYCFETN